MLLVCGCGVSRQVNKVGRLPWKCHLCGQKNDDVFSDGPIVHDEDLVFEYTTLDEKPEPDNGTSIDSILETE